MTSLLPDACLVILSFGLPVILSFHAAAFALVIHILGFPFPPTDILNSLYSHLLHLVNTTRSICRYSLLPLLLFPLLPFPRSASFPALRDHNSFLPLSPGGTHLNLGHLPTAHSSLNLALSFSASFPEPLLVPLPPPAPPHLPSAPPPLPQGLEYFPCPHGCYLPLHARSCLPSAPSMPHLLRSPAWSTSGHEGWGGGTVWG